MRTNAKSRSNGSKEKNLCVPLMSVDESRNQLWRGFATATIAKVERSYYLVSAKHAFVGVGKNPIMIFFGGESIDLSRYCFVKGENSDIAAIKLSDQIVSKLNNGVFFVTSELVNLFIPKQRIRELKQIVHAHYFNSIVSGYPSNRNILKTRMHKIGKNGLNVTTVDISDSIFGDCKINRFMYIALDYDEKKCVDDTGKPISPRSLRGMSGGPITEYLGGEDRGFFQPQGMFLRRDRGRRALIGLRYEFILEWLAVNRRHFPDPPN